MSNYNRFSVITDNNDRKNKRNELNKLMGTSSKAFSFFVLASIDFFYHTGSKQIDIINDLLRMAHQCRGMNDGRLGAYLSKVIPHTLHEKKQVAEKLGKSVKDVPLQFGKRNDEYPDFSAIQDFVSINPHWYQYGKEDTAKQFDTEKYLKSVVSKLKKENIDLNDFALMLVKSKAA